MPDSLFSAAPSAAPLRLPSRILAAAAGIVSLAALLGWALDAPGLASYVAGLARMSVPTALCLLISVACVFALPRTAALPNAFRVLVLPVIATGLYVIFSYIVGDRSDPAQKTAAFGYIWGPGFGSISVATAINLLLLGTALLSAGVTALRRLPVICATLGLGVAWFDLIGHSFGVQALYEVTAFASMSIPTSISFTLIFVAVLLVRQDESWLATVASRHSGGAVFRRLLPFVVLAPLILPWLMSNAVEGGAVDAPFAFAVVAVATLAILVFATVLVSAFLGRYETALKAEMALRRASEEKVATQLERMNLLNQITRAIGERQDMASIFQVVVRTLEDRLPVDFACISHYDKKAHALVVAHVGVASSQFAAELTMHERAVVPIDQNGLSRCVGGQLVYEADVREVPFPFPRRIASGGLRALVVAPIVAESATYGVLMVARRQPESFSSSDCEFLHQLSLHIGLAVQQAELRRTLEAAYDDLRQTQQAFVQQERLRVVGQMASGIAHDINNAISPLSLQTDLLIESEPTLGPRQRAYLETVKRVIDDVSATVARLREFYRGRGEEVVREPVGLNLMAQQVVDLTRARWSDMAQQRGAVVDARLDLDASLPPVLSAANEVREALTNLVFNAVDAMPEGGVLSLRTRTTGAGSAREVIIEVTDSGIGMSEEARARCLEPFFTTKGDQGTGLGLPMVFGFAQRHGAALEIDSTPGMGTTIRLRFAAAPDQTPVAPAAAAPEKSTPLRVLIIDDDPLVLSSLNAALSFDGHDVVEANGGQAGIDAFHAALTGSPFDIVLTDLGMPYVDGNRVARAIKTAAPAIPVILLTGWGRRLGDEGDEQTHIDLILAKPPKRAELREALKLARPRPA